MPSLPAKQYKTVLVPLFQGVEALHILRTDIFATLAAQSDIRLVCLVPSAEKSAYYAREFPPSERLVYEVIDGYHGGFLERLLARAKIVLLRTATTDIKREIRYEETGSRARYLASLAANRLLARPLVRALARFADAHLVRDAFFAPLFERYEPSLVFLAHLFADVEIALLREAKRRGVPSLGFVNSWDKLTSRCILRLIPDELIVPNELTRAEATQYHDVPAERVYVSGPPQFDVYHKLTPTPRAAFCKALGIDPAATLMLFCPVGRAFSNADWGVIELLDRAITDGRLPAALHVLVRYPPNDTVDERTGTTPGRFTFIRPGVRFSARRGVDWDMGPADQQSLVDDIYHSALVVCAFSTMTIDAAVLDRPVINLDLHEGPAQPLHRMYERTHYTHILATGGARVVESEEALLEAIRAYLAHPEVDAAGRARIREEQIGALDGGAGARVAARILRVLERAQ